ncbi:uncharacterized protein TRIREDRAFT_119556 [Trichoderma reesei QM6a]|uniref:Predicted protein n=2 Tax=Hypocrea jecorina TaxID=51453 RepID=G0R989_HYPJQ|nr:uncharacterized protein TRIREDRAFT_119556 [Trichoderma reesei QM6a]EGR52661.1 predicted protein [Trichoderma reesei QM6a]ETS06222.1 hypothetical protein M419DRAFT_139603 [Trichoderma reesei RUT C-30]
MFSKATTRAALLALLLQPIQAQFSNWADDQINTTICIWTEPRAALIRNKIYLDGGNINWLPGLKDGSNGPVVSSGNFQGILLTYNLSYAFTPETNVTGLLLQDKLSKALGGLGQTNGDSPNYVDGALLANDDEFFFYGGLPLGDRLQYAAPAKDDLLVYQVYQYGAEKPLFEPGFHRLDNLPNSVSQFVTYGGAANAPSENLAWYFSGSTSQSGGAIFQNFNDTTRPSRIANSLITLDMTTQGAEKWSNKSLPSTIKGRASSELVWVPVGAKGILVALGGVVFPEYANATRESQDAKASESQSPAFMRAIDVYDVAGNKWYTQPTKDGPGTRARGCAVVATASDSSSFNIYYYGGYDGIDPTKPFHDDVWVLSLPSFTWTQINNGTESHARAGHKCFTPYPDQMMIIGGYTPASGTTLKCLEDGPIVMFNLTSGEWMDSYDPTVYGDYGVPEKVQAVIGGTASGGATATKPAASGWADPDLGKVFDTSYDQKKITTYWPYPAIESAHPPAQPSPTPPSKSGGLPSWVGPVLGVILGLIALTCIIVLFCLWRRRKNIGNRSSTNTSDEAGHRILSWIRGQPATNKAPTETTTEVTPGSPEMREYVYPSFTPSNSASVPPEHHEMADTQLVELPDTTRVELQDTGLSPMDIRERYSHWFPGRTDDGLPSPTRSSLQSTSARNTVSPIKDRNSDSHTAISSALPSPPLPEAGENDEKSLLPTPEPATTPAAEKKAESTDESARSPEGHEFVVSPPTAEEKPGDDYLTVKKTSSSSSPTTRKSVFKEQHDDT